MNKLWNTLAIVAVLIFVAGITFSVVGFVNTRVVDGYVGTAKQAGTAEQMAYRLDLATAEMERLGMTEGYSIPVFATYRSHQGYKLDTLRACADRARVVATETHLTSFQQSQALADLRVSIGAIVLHNTDWWLINHGLAFIWFPFCLCYMAICLLGMLIIGDQLR